MVQSYARGSINHGFDFFLVTFKFTGITSMALSQAAGFLPS